MFVIRYLALVDFASTFSFRTPIRPSFRTFVRGSFSSRCAWRFRVADSARSNCLDKRWQIPISKCIPHQPFNFAHRGVVIIEEFIDALSIAH
jgi:hypothetical protein